MFDHPYLFPVSAAILQIASDLCGYKVVDKLFYSRTRFQFPEKQHRPHLLRDHEVEILDRIIASGSSYVMGKTSSDHWYLYFASERVDPETGGKELSRTPTLVVGAEAAAAGAAGGDPQQQQQQGSGVKMEATGEAEKLVHDLLGSPRTSTPTCSAHYARHGPA